MKTDVEKLLSGSEPSVDGPAPSVDGPAPSVDGPAPSVDATRGLERFRARVASEGIVAQRSAHGLTWLGSSWPKALAAAAAVVLVATTLTLSGAADSFLKIFEPQRFEAVPISSGDLAGLPDLSAYGTLTWSAQPKPHDVANAQSAAAETGFALLQPATLPRSVSGSAQWSVIARTTATFRFSAAAATTAAARLGRTPPPMPAGMDGSAVRVDAGPAAFARWGESLVVIQARAPIVSADGVTLEQLRAYLLAQPGISPQLAARIRAIGDPSTTALLPIPMDVATSHHASVRGMDVLVVTDASLGTTGLVWRSGDLVYAVAGTMTEAEALSLATSLR